MGDNGCASNSTGCSTRWEVPGRIAMTLAPGTPLVDVAQGATLEHSDGGQCGHSCPAGVVHASAAPCWLCAGSASVDRSWVTQCDWTRAPQPARRLSTKAIVATDL